MRTDIFDRKEDILQWIKQELPLYEISDRLKCKQSTLKSYLEKMGIDYKGQQFKKGFKGGFKYTDIQDYLQNCKHPQSHKTKIKLIKFGVKKVVCEICGLTEWNGLDIPLELHHVDGNHFNNSLDNLQLLCPNCHAQQGNNSGSAVGFYNSDTRKETIQGNMKNYKDPIHTQSTIGKRKKRIDESVWINRKNIILSCGVDITKFGWKSLVQEKTELTRRQIDNTIKHFQDEFYQSSYIRGKTNI